MLRPLNIALKSTLVVALTTLLVVSPVSAGGLLQRLGCKMKSSRAAKNCCEPAPVKSCCEPAPVACPTTCPPAIVCPPADCCSGQSIGEPIMPIDAWVPMDSSMQMHDSPAPMNDSEPMASEQTDSDPEMTDEQPPVESDSTEATDPAVEATPAEEPTSPSDTPEDATEVPPSPFDGADSETPAETETETPAETDQPVVQPEQPNLFDDAEPAQPQPNSTFDDLFPSEPATDAPATDTPATDAPVEPAPANDSGFDFLNDEPATDEPATDAPAETDSLGDLLDNIAPEEPAPEAPAADPFDDLLNPTSTEDKDRKQDTKSIFDELFGALDSIPALYAAISDSVAYQLASNHQVSHKSITSLDETEFRVWSDNSGTFTTQGRLIMITPSHVRLLKDNGRTCTVPIERLSPAAAEYVNEVNAALSVSTDLLASH